MTRSSTAASDRARCAASPCRAHRQGVAAQIPHRWRAYPATHAVACALQGRTPRRLSRCAYSSPCTCPYSRSRQSKILTTYLVSKIHFIDYICLAGIKTEIFYLWRPYLRDPFDDHVLELAINSNAAKIITFNKKDFLEAEKLGITIQTPKEFLEEIEEAAKWQH